MTDLGAFTPAHINSAGQVTGSQTDPSDNVVHAVLWSKGSLTFLPLLAAKQPALGTAINDIGTVCGVGYNASGKPQAVSWQNKTLQIRSGPTSYGNGINDAGDIAGCGSYSDFAGNLYIFSFIRLASGAYAYPYGKGNADISSAMDINAAGYFIPAAGGSQGFFYTAQNQGSRAQRPDCH